MKNQNNQLIVDKITRNIKPLKREITSSYQFFSYLISKHKSILVILIIFLLWGILAGLAGSDKSKATEINSLMETYSNLGLETTKTPKLFYQIFFQNLKALSITIILGLTVIVPPILLLFEGMTLATVFDSLFRFSAIGLIDKPVSALIVSLLPHGIIELSVIVFCTFLSILTGLKIIFTKKIAPDFNRRNFLFKVAKGFIFIIIPLILLAAFMESFVSGSLSINMSVNQIQKDKILNNIVLNSSDINSLGQTSREEDIKSKNIFEKNEIVQKQMILSIYDEKNYEILKRTKPEHFIYKSFNITNNSSLAITIQKFRSEQDANAQIEILHKIFDLLQKENPEYKVTRLDNQLYKVHYSDKISYYKTDKINNYILSMTYKGNNLELFKKIINLQASKIAHQ